MWVQEGPDGVVHELHVPLRVYLPGGSAVELDILNNDLRIRAFVGGEQLVIRPSSQVAAWIQVESAIDTDDMSRATHDLYAEDRELKREYPAKKMHVADHVLGVLRGLDTREYGNRDHP